jgi:histidyl-tRNA synthetase
VTFDSTLVRGFDYYTRTVFEVKHSSLGARDAICGGGRYDNLIADLGGPDLGALGFAVGTEATLLAAARAGLEVGGAALPSPAAYVVAITPADRPTAYGLVSALREAGYAAEMDHEDRSPRAQMRQANTRGARLTVILGPEEAQKGTVKIKRMSSGEETTVAQSDLVAAVARFLAADGTNARP